MISFELLGGVFFFVMLVFGLFLTIHLNEMERRKPSVVQHETTKEIRKIMDEMAMSFSDEALKNIIIENIDDKVIVGIAGRLYQGWLPSDERKECEYKLTTLLLNKQYEKDKPIKERSNTNESQDYPPNKFKGSGYYKGG